MNADHFSARGFSLIELVFVLAVIGALSSFGYAMINSARHFEAERKTEAAISEILLKTSAQAASGSIIPPASFFADTTDGYGRNLKIVTADSADICSNIEGIPLILCKNEDCSDSEILTNAAVVAISAGQDGVFSLSADLTSVRFFPGSNDDKAAWTSVNEVINYAGCGSPLKIITENIPPVNGGSMYTAEIHSLPPAEKWCAEADQETSAILNISTSCSAESDFTESPSFIISSFAQNISSPSVREIKVHALRRDRRTTAVFAVPFNPEAIIEETAEASKMNINDVIVLTKSGGIGENISLETNDDDEVTSFQVNSTLSSESECVWYGLEFAVNGIISFYYEVRTLYTDNDPHSLGSSFPGFGMAFIPAEYKPEDAGCGQSGSSDLGYGGLSFGGSGIILETDLFPNRIMDYMLAPSPNHIAFVPCIFPSGGKKICLGRHLDTAIPSCPDDPGCAFPAPRKINWLEDTESHPVRLEIHPGYSEGSCTSKSADGNYMLMKLWVDCENCSDTTKSYTKEQPSAFYCMDNDGERMNNFRFGFTFGGRSDDALRIENFLFYSQ
jgi:prepilin-type N-terminal cleavage/methylation domain-containing protein